MKILVFNMTYPEQKWDIYLKEALGEELAAKCNIETTATAKTHEAKISILNFDGNKETVNKIKSIKYTEGGYIASGHKTFSI